MKINWYIVFTYTVVMIVIGILIFDNIVSILILGLVGAVMAGILHSENTNKKIDWYMVSIFTVMMITVGYFVFDNIVSILIFGFAGASMAGILYSKNTQSSCEKSE